MGSRKTSTSDRRTLLKLIGLAPLAPFLPAPKLAGTEVFGAQSDMLLIQAPELWDILWEHLLLWEGEGAVIDYVVADVRNEHLVGEYTVAGGPVHRFCISLRVAHIRWCLDRGVAWSEHEIPLDGDGSDWEISEELEL